MDRGLRLLELITTSFPRLVTGELEVDLGWLAQTTKEFGGPARNLSWLSGATLCSGLRHLSTFGDPLLVILTSYLIAVVGTTNG